MKLQTIIFLLIAGIVVMLSGIVVYLIDELTKSDAYAHNMAKRYSSCESKRITLVFKEYQCRKGYPKKIQLEDVLKEGNL